MLYSTCESVWLPLYLPINKKIMFIGHGRVALTGIKRDSIFLKKGINSSCGAATCQEDLDAPRNYLKSVDVLCEKRLDDNAVMFDYIHYRRKKAIDGVIFPFASKDPAFKKRFLTDKDEDDAVMFDVFDQVNKTVSSNNVKSDYNRFGFIWDGRCVGVGGPKDVGISERVMNCMDSVVQDFPRLTDCSIFKSTLSKCGWTKADKLLYEELQKKSDEYCTFFSPNPPVVPRFISKGRPMQSTFVYWKKSSCWYGIWRSLYGPNNTSSKMKMSFNVHEPIDIEMEEMNLSTKSLTQPPTVLTSDSVQNATSPKRKSFSRKSLLRSKSKRRRVVETNIEEDSVYKFKNPWMSKMEKRVKQRVNDRLNKISLVNQAMETSKSVLQQEHDSRTDDTVKQIDGERTVGTESELTLSVIADEVHYKENDGVNVVSKVKEDVNKDRNEGSIAEEKGDERDKEDSDSDEDIEQCSGSDSDVNPSEDENGVREKEKDESEDESVNVKRLPWKSALFNMSDEEEESSLPVVTKKELKMVRIMEENYLEYFIDIDLDDIILRVRKSEVDEEILAKEEAHLRYGYKPSKGNIILNIERSEIPIPLEQRSLNKLTRSSQPVAHIVYGIHQILVLRTKLKMGLLKNPRIICCLVVRKDGNVLQPDEILTYVTSRQLSSISDNPKDCANNIRKINGVCKFLYEKIPSMKLHNVNQLKSEIESVLTRRIPSGRSYILIAKHCLGKAEKERRILKAMDKHGVLRLCDVAQEYLLRQDDDVIELFLQSICRAINPEIKSLNRNIRRSTRKKADRRIKARKLPAAKEFFKKHVDDCVNVLKIVRRFMDIAKVGHGFLYKLFKHPEKKSVSISYLHGISDFTCEWVFKQDDDDYYEILEVVSKFFKGRYSDYNRGDIKKKYENLVLEADGILRNTRYASRKSKRNSKSCSKKASRSQESDEEFEDQESEEEQTSEGEEKVNDGQDTGTKKDDTVNLDNNDEDSVNLNHGANKPEASRENDNVLDDNVNHGGDNEGEASNMVKDVLKLKKGFRNDSKGVKRDICPVEKEVEAKCTAVDDVNDNNKHEKPKRNEEGRQEKGKRSTDHVLTICNNVEGISLNMEFSDKSKKAENDNKEERNRAFQSLERFLLSEPKMDIEEVPEEDPPGCLTEVDFINMNNCVKRLVSERKLKIGFPQSLWLIKDVKTFTVRQWLRNMFIPSKHRINKVCSYEMIRLAHSQLFSLAAEGYLKAYDMKDVRIEDLDKDGSVKAMVDGFGMLYFGARQEEYRRQGWTLLKGFCTDREIKSSLGKHQSCFSFASVEQFMDDLPDYDYHKGNALWERVCDSAEDDIVKLAAEGKGRSITSTYAVTTYLEKKGTLWKDRAVLDMCLAMTVSTLQIACVMEGEPSVYIPNTGGRGIDTDASTERQDLHCDFEVEQCITNKKKKEEPGVSVMVSGKNGFPLWVVDDSHYYMHEPRHVREKRKVHCKKVWVPPHSIIVFRGDLCHAGGGGQDGVVAGNKRYHLPFIPRDQDVLGAVHFVTFGDVSFAC